MTQPEEITTTVDESEVAKQKLDATIEQIQPNIDAIDELLDETQPALKLATKAFRDFKKRLNLSVAKSNW
ncbi:MAG: hypothetical protein SGI77_04365 [Pirellulaceae bacterium]|nr:hypothetical protein [Pirellulaceae bacterium]